MANSHNQQYQEGDNKEPDLSGYKIMVVEDDPVNLRLIHDLIIRTGAHVIQVQNGHQAIERVKKGDVDLVLMDIQLPGLSGYETTRKIKAIRKDLPVIAQTANAFADDRKKTLEAGCNEFISKPIHFNDFYTLLYKYLVRN